MEDENPGARPKPPAGPITLPPTKPITITAPEGMKAITEETESGISVTFVSDDTVHEQDAE